MAFIVLRVFLPFLPLQLLSSPSRTAVTSSPRMNDRQFIRPQYIGLSRLWQCWILITG